MKSSVCMCVSADVSRVRLLGRKSSVCMCVSAYV